MTHLIHFAAIVLICIPSLAPASHDESESAENATIEQKASLRRPSGIAVLGDMAFVANRASGSVTCIRLSDRKIVGETDLEGHLTDIAACRDTEHLLAIDESRDQLVVLRSHRGSLDVCRRIDVPPSPVTLSVSPDGKWCSVASLWARQLTILEVAALLRSDAASRPVPESSSETKSPAEPAARAVDLAIAPRTQCWLDNVRVVVADSFGGRLNILDANTARLLGRIKIEGHNIRGLALNADKTKLFIAHQILNSREPTERSRVFWGDVLGNLVRSVEVAHLKALCSEVTDASTLGGRTAVRESDGSEPLDLPDLERVAHWTLHPLGEPGNAAGDPGPILVNRAGQTILLLSGVGEIAVRRGDHKVFTRRGVGRRPVAGALTRDGTTALIANHFDDSISFVSMDRQRVTDTVALADQRPLTPVEQGEVLFYDARLSLDSWYSCHSCHSDGHTNGLLNDNFSDGSYGAPKRVLSLLGVAHTAPWAWTGTQDSLQKQVATSIEITMQGQHPDNHRTTYAEAIAAYLRSLKPPPSVDQARQTLDNQAIERGRQLFAGIGCAECHKPGNYTSDGVFDMQTIRGGLLENRTTSNETQVTEFNPPSLRGLSQRTQLLHNGSARDIDDVFAKSRHGDYTDSLDAEQKLDLKAFLLSL